MTRAQAILVTLVAYQVALIVIGLWARSRTHDNLDFFLGGRRLGGWVASLSASASSSSAWTLLGVSGAAYAWGVSALWIFPATVSGFLVNWLWVAPRLMRQSRDDGSLTLSVFLAGDRTHPMYPAIIRLSTVAILFSFLFYIASQFQAAGHAFSSSFGLDERTSIAVGVAIVVLYTLLGGFWAVSVTDTLQGLLMVAAAVVLPAAALVGVGGFGELAEGLRRVSSSGQLSLTGGLGPVLGVAFVLGTLGIGLGYPGQPHVVNRFMALRDAPALARGRVVAIAWAVAVYAGMLLLGLCGRVLYAAIPDGEQVFFAAANDRLPPVIAGIMVAAVLSAIMSTADSQLLVATSSVTYDLRRAARRDDEPATAGLLHSRIVVVALSVLAMLIALSAPAAIFSRVLFAWHALGSAFGPPLLLRLTGHRLDPRAVFWAIAAGFGLTVLLHWFTPDAPGDWVERLVPLAASFLVASLGRRRAPAP
jgi:sodium/proline symporter